MPTHLTTINVSSFGEGVVADIKGRTSETWRAVDQWAAVLQGMMQQGAPWTDHTGDARRSIYATPEQTDSGGVQGRTVHVGYGVAYGEDLELGRGGRYAIIRPALDVMFPALEVQIHEVWTTPGGGSNSGSSMAAPSGSEASQGGYDSGSSNSDTSSGGGDL